MKKEQHIKTTYAAVPEIATDKKLLGNILINLISNTIIRYSPENFLIKINAVQENGYVKYLLARAWGIPETEKKHLFERFFPDHKRT